MTASSDPSGRWALVTGAAQRLGREIALALARQGWHVAVHYHRSADAAQRTVAELQALGMRAVAVAQALDEPDAADRLLAAVCEATGAVPHCVVNNASTFEPDAGSDVTEALLLRQLRVNTVVPVLLGRALWAALGERDARADSVAAGAYSVIHVLDQKVHNLNPDYFSYTISKLALERTVALQAQALAPRVRVCGVSPGLIYVSGPQSEANFQRARRVNLLRSPIDPARVAETVAFLAGNPSLDGVVVPVDNGQHLVPLARDVMFVVEEGTP